MRLVAFAEAKWEGEGCFKSNDRLQGLQLELEKLEDVIPVADQTNCDSKL